MQRKIRQSQTIVPFGVGAIFDIKGESLVGCDIFRWGARGETIQSERLAAALGAKYYRLEELKSGELLHLVETGRKEA